MKDKAAAISNLIDNQSVVYLSSVDEKGYPNTKAMLAPRKREGMKVFYFHTNTSSMRVAQFRSNPHACLYFCSKNNFTGAMLTGAIEVLEDAVHKELLWQEGDTMYYTQGVTDPDYCVLRFTAEQGRYYSNFSSENFVINSAE